MDAGVKQDLVGVDIADAGDDPLVEQAGLDASAPAGEGFPELGEPEGQGLGPEPAELRGRPGFGGRERHGEPELPDVAEAEFAAGIPESDGQVGVLVARSARFAEKQLAGHLEVEEEGQPPREVDDDHLTPAPDAENRPAPERPQARRSGTADDRRKKDPDLPDLPPGQPGPEAADDGLDFGELGHGPILAQS